MRYFVSLILVFALSGCYTCSNNPLSTFEEIKSNEPPFIMGKRSNKDNSILGTWLLQEESVSTLLFIGKSSANTDLLRVVMISTYDDNTLGWTIELVGHTTRLGENSYLNLKLLEPDYLNEKPCYIIIKYEYSLNSLKLFTINDGFVQTSISSGKLKGKGSTITDTTEALQKYVIDYDKSLFRDEIHEMMLLRKLDLRNSSREVQDVKSLLQKINIGKIDFPKVTEPSKVEVEQSL